MLCILTALDLCNFQQYCIVLSRVKESSRRGDVTVKAAAEWWKGAGTYNCVSKHELSLVSCEDISPEVYGKKLKAIKFPRAICNLQGFRFADQSVVHCRRTNKVVPKRFKPVVSLIDVCSSELDIKVQTPMTALPAPPSGEQLEDLYR